MYILAILLPPLAVLLANKNPLSFLLNLLLCFVFWVPAVIHAVLVINEKKADKRADKMAQTIAKANQGVTE